MLRILSKKKDIRIVRETIYILKPSSKERRGDLGNGSWGKIDFLVNYQKYIKVWVYSWKEVPKRSY